MHLNIKNVLAGADLSAAATCCWLKTQTAFKEQEHQRLPGCLCRTYSPKHTNWVFGLYFLWGFLSTFIAALHYNYSSVIPRDNPKRRIAFILLVEVQLPYTSLNHFQPVANRPSPAVLASEASERQLKIQAACQKVGFLQRGFCLHWNIFRVCKLQQVEKAWFIPPNSKQHTICDFPWELRPLLTLEPCCLDKENKWSL